MLKRYVTLWPWLLTLNICSRPTSSIAWSKSVRKLVEIEQSPKSVAAFGATASPPQLFSRLFRFAALFMYVIFKSLWGNVSSSPATLHGSRRPLLVLPMLTSAPTSASSRGPAVLDWATGVVVSLNHEFGTNINDLDWLIFNDLTTHSATAWQDLWNWQFKWLLKHFLFVWDRGADYLFFFDAQRINSFTSFAYL